MASSGGTVRFKRARFHYPAFTQMRKSAEVRAALLSAGERIANAAGGATEGFLVVESDSGTRARVLVITAEPEAMVAEATDRRLTNALGAGRG